MNAAIVVSLDDQGLPPVIVRAPSANCSKSPERGYIYQSYGTNETTKLNAIAAR